MNPVYVLLLVTFVFAWAIWLSEAWLGARATVRDPSCDRRATLGKETRNG
jgi:hypothetical protein